MRLEEYLNTVTEQIRCIKARELVSRELKDHIEDQAEAYEADGMFEEEALERAVRDMGDPVEVGVSLDRIHRPQMSWSMLALVGVISILSIAVHAALGGSGQEYLWRHIGYTAAGYILMLVVYRLDYSILSRYGKQIAGLFLLFILLGGRSSLTGVMMNGAIVYIRLGGVLLHLPTLLYLYVPLYGSVLYLYRGEGYRGLAKIFLWTLVPVWIALRIPSLDLAVTLVVTFALLFSVAVCQNWYGVNKKRTLAVLWISILAAPVLLLGLLYASGNLSGYQMARIHAWISGSQEYDHIGQLAGSLFGSSHLLGRNEENIALLEKLPGFNSNYIFVSLTSAYGILAGTLAVALLLLLAVKIFRISFRQRNQLGMILGCGCGSVFLLQIVLNLAVNLGLLPSAFAMLPFFSFGGSGLLVSYMLLGLVLSIYRYKNILPQDLAVPKRKTAGFSLRFKRAEGTGEIRA